MSSPDVLTDLINEVKLVADKSVKEDRLAQLQELILHQYKTYLSDYYGVILEFEAEKLVDVRKWVAAFIEATCKADPLCMYRNNLHTHMTISQRGLFRLILWR
jgi:hypothetical protein